MSKRSQSSTIWESFTRSQDGLHATCSICEAVLVCRNYGTSSLFYHLKKSKHSPQNDTAGRSSSCAKRQKVLPFVAKAKVTEEELYAKLVTYDNFPPCAVAKSNFIRSSMKSRGFKEITAASSIAEKVKQFDVVV